MEDLFCVMKGELEMMWKMCVVCRDEEGTRNDVEDVLCAGMMRELEMMCVVYRNEEGTRNDVCCVQG